MRLTIPERIASDVDIYVRDEVHADPVTGDDDEAAFLRGRAVIVAGWRARKRGAVLDLPDDPAALLDVYRVMLDLANREDAAPTSAAAYYRITLAISKEAERLKARGDDR